MGSGISIVFGILGLYLVTMGIYQLITGRFAQSTQMNKMMLYYTYESIQKYVKVNGVFELLLGIDIILETLIDIGIIRIGISAGILSTVLIVLCVAYLISTRVILKKIR